MTLEDFSEEQRQSVETFISDWLTQHRIPGAAVAVTEEGSVVAEGFGARTLENNTPVTGDTLFGIGSCTKAFTATAIMQLVEQGELALDDPVDEYIPHLIDVPGEPVTVEELLTHTSGMPSDDVALPLVARQFGAGGEVPLSSEADYRRHVQGSTDRRVTDRETFFYYNSGYIMLGRIIETVSGKEFAAYLEEELLSPLGLERVTFDRDVFEEDDDRMTPYMKQEGQSAEAPFPFDPLIYPGGGLVSSVRDLAHFVRELLDGESGDEALLTAESRASMTSPVATRSRYLDGKEVGYGYGLAIEEFLGDDLISHGGSIGVSNAWFGYLEEAELGVAIACTTTPETHPAKAGRGVLALLKDEDPDEVLPYYQLKNALKTASGEYAGYQSISQASVERIGSNLKLQVETAAGGQEFLLVPTSVEEAQLSCTTADPMGMKQDVRFELQGDEVDLFISRFRFTKSA
ncbi:serine hydrolase [Halalkalirubrum salinum]|uniref:serine hydrolase n=1 Tax=Halalkalirubrum salinum TaxID=2563889 RepID=UPI00148527AE|nr:serine hydrolase [Halalkalirubrum salinum]